MLLATTQSCTDAVTFRLEPLPALDVLQRQWTELDRGGAHSFFVSWNWVGPFLRCAGSGAKLVRVMQGDALAGLALLWSAGGRVRGFVPVRRCFLNATGRPDIDAVMVEHNGFAVPSGNGESLLPAVAQWFRDGGVSADELVLPGVQPSSASADRWLVKSRRAAFRTPLKAMSEAGLVSLLSRNARQQLRRSLRDYGDDLHLERAADVPAALAYFEALRQLHVKSWARRGRTHAFAKPFFERFHRAVIEQGVGEGAVDLLRVRAGPRVLGYLYNFVRNGVVSSYQSGFADDEPGLRPGYVCHAVAIDDYASKGLQCYDFLAGTNRLKESFGTETYELSWLQVRKPRFAFWLDKVLRDAGQLFAKS